ncbi:MAG: hemolysin family protein [Spirochaetota bacterium]|nr:hemolysin family protein [Spirochaetota bacterium]
MTPLFITIFIVLVVSAICSLVEAALFTVPINRVRAWVNENYRFSPSLLKIKESMQKPIATIVILNNISNIVGSIFVGSMMADEFDKLWVGIISGIFTFLIILLSELIPKIMGEHHADTISLLAAKPILLLTKLFTPILKVLEWITKPLLRGKSLTLISDEEIKVLARLSAGQGILEKEEEEIIHNALILNDIKVKEIMTPRMKVICLDENQTLKDVMNDLMESPFSRFPLYKETMDNIVGLLYKSDAFKALCQGNENIKLCDLSKEVLFVPENKPLDKLMEKLRISQSHTAIVIDEYGGTAGLVTLEDVLEELVGDIVGEEDMKEEKYIVISNDEILAPGFTTIDDINEFFNTDLENHRTISKLILDHLNRFPDINENIEWENFSFIIEEVTSKTIEKVRIKRTIVDLN